VTAILGINCFSHDTAAALLVDGQLVALGEEERFNRDRHTKAFPHSAIGACLAAAGLGMADVQLVAVAQRPALDWGRGALDAFRRRSGKRLAAQTYTDARLVSREVAFRRRWGYRGRLLHVGHHNAHAAAAFFASPFDRAAVLTLDRGGDFLSTTLSLGEGSRLHTLRELRNPDSLGEVYTALTWFLGFRPNADEGKVMGLAPYGTDRLVKDLDQLISTEPGGLFRVDLSWFAYQVEGKVPLSARFLKRYGQPRVPESTLADRDKDLAFAVQDLTERTSLHVGRVLRSMSTTTNLCLSGGVALNSVMNARLATEAGFTDIFVQPASSDAGNALGAALWAWHQHLGNPRSWAMEHAFWGVSYTEEELAGALRQAGVEFRRVDDPADAAAGLLADGKVIGWFQGRAEVGPRALGTRSILADPRRPDMRDVVNARVKRREWFRPFAPAVMHERGPAWFDEYRYSPFMLLVLPVRPEQRERIPAVCHVDGTGRVQSVRQDADPLFYRLLACFERRTGVPVVLNTSFNLRGEPIVHRPAEAVQDYLASDMHALFLGPFVAEKEG
jgi:carbamoyltransferase